MMKNRVLQILLISILLTGGLLISAGEVSATEITARLSRNPVMLNESVELILEASETPDGEPDYSPLYGDFDLLTRSQNQNLQVINGDVQRNISWHLTLMPKRAGTIQIPAIPFGNDQSQPITLRVTSTTTTPDAQLGGDLFIKVKTSSQAVYQQAQLLLTIQLHRAININSATLSEPETDDPDALIKRLGEDTQFETRIKGRRYQVTERKYVIFPQQSGPLTVRPIVFQGEVMSASAKRGLFGRFTQRGQIRRIHSQPLEVTVKPRPPQATSSPWLPSSNLQLVETLPMQGGEIRVGEPITRTYLLFADGLTSAAFPPITTQLPVAFKQYPDQPTLKDREGKDGIIGIRQEKVAIVPTSPGEYLFPAIEIKWWNTGTEAFETARIPARTIHVLASTVITEEPVPPPAEMQRTPANSPSLPAMQGTGGTATGQTLLGPYSDGLILLLASGWMLTLLAWWYSTKKRGEAATAPPPAEHTRSAKLSRLKQACHANDPEAAAHELLAWAGARWPDAPPHSLGALAAKVNNLETAEAIRELDAVLYAPHKETWDGSKLWEIIKNLPTESGTKGETNPIAPLHL